MPDTSPTDPVFEYSDRLVARFAELHPAQATYLGVPGHDDRWEDLSPAGHAARAELWRGCLRDLARLPAPGDRWAKLAHRVLAEYCKDRVAAYEAGDQHYDLNNIASSFQTLRMVFDVMDTSTYAGWEAIAARMERLDEACRSYASTFREGLTAGRIPSRRQVLAALDQGKIHSGEGSFFRTLARRHLTEGTGDAALGARLERAAGRARAAFGGLCEVLEREILPRAPQRDAVGDERYARAAREHVGMALDPAETYAWGWSRVHEIESAMKSVAAKIGPGLTVPEVIARLKSDPAQCASSADAFLDFIRARQAQALAQLDGVHFAVPPPARAMDVKLSPPGNALGAYYVAASEDFSRPGGVWYVLGDPHHVPLYDEVSTSYHEGFPGHHLQVSVQIAQRERLGRFQRLAIANTGYCEGWALYAEQLMHELGYLERPEYVLGMLATQLLRAWRVVIDIGCHLGYTLPADSGLHPGARWDFDVAVEALRDRAFQDPAYAVSEATRYLGWPAQAPSYMIGQRVILALREDVRARRGAAFSLFDFHESVLALGAIGLDLLREVVLE